MLLNYFIGDYYADCSILYTYLLEMKDDIVSGTDRNLMLYVNKKKGGSTLYGHTWRKYLTPTRNRTPSKIFKGLCQTKIVDQYPEFQDICKEFSDLYFPDFFYSQIQINRNYTCPAHYDSTNQGESIIIGLGDYDGGELVINKSHGEFLHMETHDLTDCPVQFDGSKYAHGTLEYEGDRYSLVFFNNIKNYKEKLLQ